MARYRSPARNTDHAPAATPSAAQLGGGISVTAITDAVADHPQPLEKCFPGAPADGWAATKETYPGTVGADGRWRLPVICYLVRTPQATMLVDTGIGSSQTLASEVFHVVGGLPLRLASLGVQLADVDAVLFTHVHEDHLGWALDVETRRATFPHARYLVHRLEWEANHAGAAPDWVVQSLQPLEQAGRLEQIELGPLDEVIDVVALPGHTPGHCGFVVSGPEARVTLVGDAFNHPLQVSDPDVPSVADGDRGQASATRRDVLARVASGEWERLGSAHLPGGWWTAEDTDAGRRWASRSDAARAPVAPDAAYAATASLGLRLGNLREGDHLVLGVETDSGVLHVPATAAALGLPAPGDVDALLQNGRGDEVRAVVDGAAADPRHAVVVSQEVATFGPLVTRPEKIICVGFNYHAHARETNIPAPRLPALFSKFNNALNADGGYVELPTAAATQFDFETELVIVFGRTCHDVPEQDALSYVAGYTVGNDLSARDLQTATTQFLAGKTSDGFAPIGPWLTTADLVRDPDDLALTTTVNGVRRQDASTTGMIFGCRQLISYVSGIFTIRPGDVLFTGTPAGVIFGQQQPAAQRTWLKAGDRVVSTIEGLGSLAVTLT